MDNFNFSFNSSLHAGCVKSPLPIRWMPFLRAHRSRYSGVHSLLVALEYLEWVCKSAIYMSDNLFSMSVIPDFFLYKKI